MSEKMQTSPNASGNAPVEPIPMFRNRYFIGSVVAFIIFVIISFSGLKPSSEVIVKTLGVVLVVGTVVWFAIKPWK
jgi:hypothetical protein